MSETINILQLLVSYMWGFITIECIIWFIAMLILAIWLTLKAIFKAIFNKGEKDGTVS